MPVGNSRRVGRQRAEEYLTRHEPSQPRPPRRRGEVDCNRCCRTLGAQVTPRSVAAAPQTSTVAVERYSAGLLYLRLLSRLLQSETAAMDAGREVVDGTVDCLNSW
jgi:hypothetical protein